MDTTVLKLKSSVAPTGYVLGGCHFKIDRDEPNWGMRLNLLTTDGHGIYAIVRSYNGRLYLEAEKVREHVLNRTFTDASGNTIYEYRISVTSSSSTGNVWLYYDDNVTDIVVFENSERRSLQVLSHNYNSGSNSRPRILSFDIKECINLVPHDKCTVIQYVYSNAVQPFDISYLRDFSSVRYINFNGMKNVTGDVSVLSNLNLKSLRVISFNYTDVYGEMSSVLDDMGRALVEAGTTSQGRTIIAITGTNATLNGIRLTSTKYINFDENGNWTIES